jgi:HlyD family secretion protein
MPDAAEIATAEAQVAAAQTRLDDLLQGASDLEIEAATIKLQSALVTLGEARKEVVKATLTAPIAGSVLTVSATEGSQARAGEEVATLADLGQLELTVYVAEVDVNKVAISQTAEVEIDALPGRILSGTVTQVSPVNSGGNGAVSYAVTIALAGDLTGVLPDMTAVARFSDETVTGGWLAPTTSIQGVGDAATLSVVRADVVTEIPVTTGTVQGEWTVVYSDALQEGDQVVGAVRIPSTENQSTDTTTQGGGFPPRPPERFGGN